MAFHWSVAVLIVFLGALGLLFDDIPRESRPFWINLHGCVGLIYFALVVARLLWRIRNRPPDPSLALSPLNRRVSTAVHHLLYAVMVLVPVAGFVAFVWHARPFDYGLFRLDFGVASTPEIFRPAKEVHQVLAYALFALAGLHVAAALYHHFIRRDGVLTRMVPIARQ